jgi:Holliday junction resolvasome RuvABC endonuclease subunit
MEYKAVGHDLGKTWGWAVIEDWAPDPPVIRFGEETAGNDALTNASAGMIYHSYRTWLLDFLDKEAPTVLCYESVRFTRGVSYIEGQKGILLAELEEREIPYFGLPVGTLKKWGAGHGKAKKPQVIQAVRDRWQEDGFLQVKPWDQRWRLTDNMADALWCAHRAWVTWG